MKKLLGRQLFYVCGVNCFLLSSTDGQSVSKVAVADLISKQEEADTFMIVHLMHADTNASDAKYAVIQSPDTDVFILLLKF